MVYYLVIWTHFSWMNNESKILLFTDGGSGAAEDVAIVLYTMRVEAAEGDFTNELT